jgi:serine/threonine-protein kinase
MALEIGSRLGHYHVTALIGEGGMGQVYQATDTKLNRQVALKILPEAFAADPDRLARFQREAQVLASLNHPNIAAIHGLEDSEGTKALVLELVEGPTLADRIAQGPISVDEALPIAKQIAEALEAAHEAGVIHRDLKPANIKVRDDGTVKVLDFGLAKAFEPKAPDVSGSMSPTISLTAAATQMGMVIGTAAYMAPEQAKGLPVDRRADIWAFGAVLFEMLTGKKLFETGDVSEMLASVLVKDPDVSSIGTDVPEHVRSVIRHCLVKDPKERLRDIGDVRLAMKGVFETTVASPSEVVAVPALRVWQRPLPSMLVGLALLVIGGVAVWSVTRPEPPVVARFVHELPDGQTFRRAGRPVVTLSPDGGTFVYNTTDGLYVRTLPELDARLIAGTTDDLNSPVFSPDGLAVAYWDIAAQELKRVALSGGAPVTITAVPDFPYGITWQSDNTLLYGQEDGIWRVPDAGGTPEHLVEIDEGERVHGPQMLPDGEWVLFTFRAAGTLAWAEADIVVQSLTTGERETLIPGGRDARYVATGHLVYGLDGVILAVPFDVVSRQVLGGAVSLVDGVRATSVTSSGAMQFALADNGSLVYAPGEGTGGNTSLVWVTEAGEETPTTAPVRTYGDPRVSPDGKRIAVQLLDDGNVDVWIWSLDDGPLTRLTFDAGNDLYPFWTPDSLRVVFTSQREGGGLFWKAADGTGEVEPLMQSDDGAAPWGWTSDGRLLFDTSEGDIGVVTVDGEPTVEMLLETEFEEVVPALSPDGRWLVYQSNESGQEEIYVRPFPNVDGGRWQVSTNGGFDPVWSPDGRRLFFLQVSPFRLMVANIETDPTFSRGTLTETFDLSAYALVGGGRRYDLAPDGDRFILRHGGADERRRAPDLRPELVRGTQRARAYSVTYVS